MIKHNTFEINSFLESLKKMESEAIKHAEFIKKGRKEIETQISELNKIVGLLNQFTNINPDQSQNDQENTAGSGKEVTNIQLKNNFENQKPLEGSSQKSECPDQKVTVVQEPSKPLEGIDKNEPGRNERVLSVFEPGKELTFPEIRDALIQKGIVWSDDEENRVRACLGKLANDNGPLGTRKIDKIRKVWFLKTSNNL